MDTNLEVSIESDLDSLAEVWNELTKRPESEITVPGCSSSWEWHKCLQGFLLSKRETLLLTARCNGKLSCILPLVIGEGSLFGMKWPVLEHWQDVAFTRPGLVTQRPSGTVVAALLRKLVQVRPWGVLKLTLISGSDDERAVLDAVRTNGYELSEMTRETTGYLSIPDLAFDHDKLEPMALSSKFRANLRRRRRLLKEERDVALTLTRDPADVDAFLRDIWEIERYSWKHDEGTSIRQQPAQEYLYTHFAHQAARERFLLGLTLRHSGKPVAYIYGVIYNGIYESLKTSYSNEYARYSPTHLMRSMLMKYLQESGVVIHDFIGVMDQAKQQWQSIPYDRVTYIIYGPGLKGQMASLKWAIKERAIGISNWLNCLKSSLSDRPLNRSITDESRN